MLNGIGRHRLQGSSFTKRTDLGAPELSANRAVRSRYQETAFGPGSQGPGGSSNVPDGTQVRSFAKPTNVGLQIGLVPTDPHMQIILAREMYENDAVLGAVADTYASIPFGPFSLSGLPSKETSKPYEISLDRVRSKSLMPVLATSHLVDGAFLGGGLWDDGAKVWNSIIPYDILHSTITPAPFFGATPIVDIRLQQEAVKSIRSGDERMQRYRKYLPENYISSGVIKLPQENTFYIPRGSLSHVSLGVSIYRKLMIVYILEKALARGTIEKAYRRQGPMLHIQAGDENWDASIAEMQYLSDVFMAADLDPLGAVVVTRPGVNPQEVGGIGDFWKWTDNIDVLTSIKLKGMGMPDGLLGGDMALDSVSATLTVFINMIRQFRDHITRLFFYEKFFPYVAITNGHRKDSFQSFEGGSYKPWSSHASDSDIDMSDYFTPSISWHNCLSGDTLVQTTSGLVRIDSMGRGRVRKVGDEFLSRTDFTVASRFKPEYVDGWVHKEMRGTYTVTTEAGTSVTGTPEHKVLVLQHGKHAWIKIGDIEPGMLTCINLDPVVRTKPLELELKAPRDTWRVKGLIAPSQMSPEMAFLMGMIVAEGTVRSHKVCVPNTDLALLERTNHCVRRVFGIKGAIRGPMPREGYKPLYELIIHSVVIRDWLVELGIGFNDKNSVRRFAYRKQVPWSVLQADRTSQLAFIAAYVEGDGFVTDDQVGIESVSERVIEQMQLMLISHGYLAKRRSSKSRYWDDRGKNRRLHHLRMGSKFGSKFLRDAREFFVSKWRDMRSDVCLDHGVPLDYFKRLIRFRRLGKGKYANDAGEVVYPGVYESNNMERNNLILYDWYDCGVDDHKLFLESLRLVSASAAAELEMLLQMNYVYSPVVGKTRNSVRDVYDLTVRDGEPAYVAGGMVVHNSLRPEGDREYMELLETLRQAGVPIPVRVLTAAGGLDIHDILNSAPDDLANRQKIAEINAQIAAMDQMVEGGGDQGGGGQEQGSRKLRASDHMYRELAPIKPKGILSRNYDTDRYSSRTEINGHRYLTTSRERRRVDEAINRKIATAAADLSYKLNREKSRPVSKVDPRSNKRPLRW